MKQEFYDYLIGTGKRPSTANSYKSAINSISRNYSQRIGEKINIYEIQEQSEINGISQKYSLNGDYSKDGYKGRGAWRCAIARYSEFFANRGNDTINKTKQESTYEDNQIISTLGVKMCASPLNQILYGPPGTGKTYSTVNKALDILLGENHNPGINSIGKLKEKFGSQVEFVTFHQSFSYEDFVEGLKAKTDDGKLSYEVENGVFKQICENAENNGNNSLEELNKAIEKLKEQAAEEPLKLITSACKKPFTLTYNGNKAFYVKPEAGEYKNPVSIDSIIKLYKNPNIKNGGNGVHRKAYTISVIEYLKDNDFDLSNYQETIDKKPHVLIIDEINRGNISRIFGELITLIEPSKRAGESEVISVKLPYSKEDFSVPNNLYIIGTMNTADRS
ncbi:McrB family protein, partial [Bathymodiolus thermophilus thioautotrophic gill symbiont]